jgi:predicted dehydrogenase
MEAFLVAQKKQSFTFAVLGAGNRGSMFADWIRQTPGVGRVVAVADPVPANREKIARLHSIPPEMQFESWEKLLERPRLADVVINSLIDRLHAPSAVKALGLGYHMLLEKPMATTWEDCVAIDRAQRKAGAIVAVCHSLRHHLFYVKIKELIQAGTIGRVMSFDQLEGVQFVHQSHSFVRGNWGNESRSMFMLMTKSCHDVDILSYLVDRPCLRVSSFGSLSYFRKENAPAGAPARCTDGCPAERDCIYSAYKVYVQDKSWAVYTEFKDKPPEERAEILKTNRFGRCVFRCDNDVVDHQVVAFEFEGGATGTFTMTAFHPGGRHIRIHGTHGFIEGAIDQNEMKVHLFDEDFSNGTQYTIKTPSGEGGHGGGDSLVMANFIQALRAGDSSILLTSSADTLATHKIAFAAECARREGCVVNLADWPPKEGRTRRAAHKR